MEVRVSFVVQILGLRVYQNRLTRPSARSFTSNLTQHEPLSFIRRTSIHCEPRMDNGCILPPSLIRLLLCIGTIFAFTFFMKFAGSAGNYW